MSESIGQFIKGTTINITSRLNRKTTGLSDVLLDLYDPGGTKILNNESMTELGTTGIYQYSYKLPKVLGTYTAVITCVTQRNYDELQYFAVTEFAPTGGGIIANVPAKVLDKKAIDRERELKKLMLSLNITIKALVKENKKLDFTAIQKEIDARLKELEESFDESTEKTKSFIDDIKDDTTKRTNEMKKLFKQEAIDWTEKVVVLENQVKALPDSFSKFTDEVDKAYKKTKTDFDRISSDINNVNKRIDSISDETSKFSSDGKDNIDKVKKELSQDISKLQQALISQTDNLPKFIEKKITELGNSLDQYKKEADQKYKTFIKSVVEEFFPDATDKMVEGIDAKIKKISEKIHAKEEEGLSLKETVDLIRNEVRKFKVENNQELKKIKNKLPKITEKRDLALIEESLTDTIKEFQSNNTKKTKVIRDKIDNIINDVEETKKKMAESKEQTDEDFKKINKKIFNTTEEVNTLSQMNLMRDEEDG